MVSGVSVSAQEQNSPHLVIKEAASGQSLKTMCVE